MVRTKVTKKKGKSPNAPSSSDIQSGTTARQNTPTGRKSVSKLKDGRPRSTTKIKGKGKDKKSPRDKYTISSSTETNERENRAKTVKRMVNAKSMKAWKPLRSTTKKYVMQLYDTATEILLSKSGDKSLYGLQTHWSKMRRRFVDKLEKTRGPVNNIASYSNLHKHLNTEAQEADKKLAVSLKRKVNEEEKECKEVEEKIKTYELYASGASKLHPLLRSEESRHRSTTG